MKKMSSVFEIVLKEGFYQQPTLSQQSKILNENFYNIINSMSLYVL